MLVLKERLIHVPVMSLQTGAQIAQTERPIIDPRQLMVVAFYCQGSTLDVTPAVLHVDDIREAGTLGFIVDDADVIMSPTDLVRLQQIISYNFSLEGKLVVDDRGQKIGKVDNFIVDMRSFYITQLQVQPSILQSWSTSQVLIGRTQILEINDKKIIVKSATVKEEPVKHAIPHNPFKQQSQAQPEATRTAHEDA
jgi:uncharacterized protein YrrD